MLIVLAGLALGIAVDLVMYIARNHPVSESATIVGGNIQCAEADAARVRALTAYKDFFALWKDADPDIPILREAKAEYAKLN